MEAVGDDMLARGAALDCFGLAALAVHGAHVLVLDRDDVPMHALHAGELEALYGAQVLPRAACWRFGLDKTEQCCGVCMPTLTERGSASWPSLHTPSRRPRFQPPRFRRGDRKRQKWVAET